MINGLSHGEFNKEIKRCIGIKNTTENRTAVCTQTIPADTPATPPPSTSRHDDRCPDVQTRVMTHDTYEDAVVSRSSSNSSEQLNSHSPKNLFDIGNNSGQIEFNNSDTVLRCVCVGSHLNYQNSIKTFFKVVHQNAQTSTTSQMKYH